MKLSLLLLGLFTTSFAVAATDLPPPGLRTLDQIDAARDARVAWHREARFGCFVHWGVYSAMGGVWPGVESGTYSEHLMRWARIPRATYLEKVARPFNPTAFDADAWVKLMHDAGMNYLVITAKHHDGFAMYPSKVSHYNLTEVTSFKRDPMAELSAACKKYGLKFGFYYSHAWDWEDPDAIGNSWDDGPPGGESNWWEKRPDLVSRASKYIDEKAIPQIRELIANYHPDILWFDTASKTPPELCRRVLAATRAAGPDVVINSRIGGGDFGDYRSTADRPAYFPEVFTHWEAIPTTNESYGYKPGDTSHKPPSHFIQLLAQAVSKGGNILMNIGPRGDGVIDMKDQAILRGIGVWMQQNGESIYGCDRTLFPCNRGARRHEKAAACTFTCSTGRLTEKLSSPVSATRPSAHVSFTAAKFGCTESMPTTWSSRFRRRLLTRWTACWSLIFPRKSPRTKPSGSPRQVRPFCT